MKHQKSINPWVVSTLGEETDLIDERSTGFISMVWVHWPCISRDSVLMWMWYSSYQYRLTGQVWNLQEESVAVKTWYWLGVWLAHLTDTTRIRQLSHLLTLVAVWAREWEKMHSSCKLDIVHKWCHDPRARKRLPSNLLILERRKAFMTSTWYKLPCTREVEFSSQLHFVVLSVSLQAVSRPFELSLQSTLQLSLTVLVCYRYYHRI